jgi:hypothetical protein
MAIQDRDSMKVSSQHSFRAQKDTFEEIHRQQKMHENEIASEREKLENLKIENQKVSLGLRHWLCVGPPTRPINTNMPMPLLQHIDTRTPTCRQGIIFCSCELRRN